MIPMFIIPIPFVFVLLILLLKKAPKVGVWAVAGVISFVVFVVMILLPIGMHDGLVPTVVPDKDEIPIFVVPLPFLFVLLIRLLNRSPKVGAAVIVGVVVMGLFGTVLWLGVSQRPMAYEQRIEGPAGSVAITQKALPEDGYGGLDALKALHIDVPQPPESPTLPELGDPAATSPIWSEGMENEYEADIYPSRKAAIRSLGSQLQGWLQQAIAEANEPPKIVLFMEEHERSLLWELERSIEDALSGIRCSVEASLRNIDRDEIGVTFQFDHVTTGLVPWTEDQGPHIVSGRVSAKARGVWGEKTVSQDFIEKPWVDDFAQYVGEHPGRQVIVARSRGACTSENEARDQALREATNQVSALVAQKWPGRPAQTISSTDLLDGGFVLDQFVQSFDGMSGRLWREAMLIDTSAQKLGRLGSRMAAEMHVERVTWARMILSAFGVLVIIVAAYLFLNMATKGYYEWSLRIAGMVLAIAGILSIFLVLR